MNIYFRTKKVGTEALRIFSQDVFHTWYRILFWNEVQWKVVEQVFNRHKLYQTIKKCQTIWTKHQLHNDSNACPVCRHGGDWLTLTQIYFRTAAILLTAHSTPKTECPPEGINFQGLIEKRLYLRTGTHKNAVIFIWGNSQKTESLDIVLVRAE